MITFLLMLANISILAIAYAIPKVALINCAKNMIYQQKIYYINVSA